MTQALIATTDLAKKIAARAEGKTGGIKNLTEGRSDVNRINPFLIKIEPGFNEREFDSETVLEHIDGLAQSIAEVGVRRPLTVRNKNGEMVLKDGECRLRATIRAIEVYGAEIVTVPVILADRSESDADATLGILVENSGLPITPLGKANVVKRLKAHGWSNAEIAARAGMSAPRVSQLLDLSGLSEDIKALIRDDTVSATLALEVTRRHEWNSASALKELKTAQQTAVAKGKKRVTAKSVATTKPIDSVAALLSNAIVTAEQEDGEEAIVQIVSSPDEWAAICALLKIENTVIVVEDEDAEAEVA